MACAWPVRRTSGPHPGPTRNSGYNGGVELEWNEQAANRVYLGDNLPILRALPDEAFQVIYIDPPFNTGKVQRRQSLKTRRIESGGAAGADAGATDAGEATAGRGAAGGEESASAGSSRVGFKGLTYEAIKGRVFEYNDSFADYWGFLEPRLVEARRLLRQSGTLYLHLDYREAHYAKVLLDAIFGRECFLNEIIWAYDYGARSKRKWPAKHDTILVYVKDARKYYFDAAQVDREPYMAPGLVSAEKAARGKLPTDVWWHTIVSPTGREKTGYATQKPLGILRRIIGASTREGDWVLDFFAGSGTTGAAAAELGRRFVLIDQNPDAIEVMRGRLGAAAEFIV